MCQESPEKAYPGGKAIRPVSWAAPLASVWGVRGDRAEQEAWGRRDESRNETDDEKVASRNIYFSKMEKSE